MDNYDDVDLANLLDDEEVSIKGTSDKYDYEAAFQNDDDFDYGGIITGGTTQQNQ